MKRHTDWPAFGQDNWPPIFMKTAIELEVKTIDEFPNYLDLTDNQENEEQVIKIDPRKNRRDKIG